MRWYFCTLGILKAYNVKKKAVEKYINKTCLYAKRMLMCLYIITVFLKGYSEMFIVVTSGEEWVGSRVEVEAIFTFHHFHLALILC